MPNASHNQRHTIAQLDFERRALLAKLVHGRPDEIAAQELMRRIEDLDLAIAAMRAANISELCIKFDRLIDALGVQLGSKDSLEAVLTNAIRDDIQRLSIDDLKP